MAEVRATEAMQNPSAAAPLAGRGWQRLTASPEVAAWAAAARGPALDALPADAAAWRAGGTWYPGVDALPNGPDGRIGGVGLPPALLSALPFRPEAWHRAQISTLRPGYPRPDPGEGAAAFGFRLRRDAAHLDGLLPDGPERRRFLREPHGFILGLPLTEADPGAAPLVVWEGSAPILRRALASVLAPLPQARWTEADLTDAYHAARREAFATCPRVELPAGPGEAVILHRLALHGIAPWAEGAQADPAGRVIAYFRPELPRLTDWLDLP
jgi:hypothetical protein